MTEEERNTLLRGVSVERIVVELHARYGWEAMARRLPLRCFQMNPSVKSSVTFLRKAPWALTAAQDWWLEGPPPALREW